MTLPKESAPSSSPASVREQEDGRLRLLLVEDSVSDALILQEMLKQANGFSFDIVHTSRISEALKALGKLHFDIILTDLGLPDGEGVSVYRSLRAAAPDRPIIVLTGRQDDEFRAQLLREGAHDYLVKGLVDSAELVRSVWNALDRKNVRDAHSQALG